MYLELYTNDRQASLSFLPIGDRVIKYVLYIRVHVYPPLYNLRISRKYAQHAAECSRYTQHVSKKYSGQIH